MKILPWILVVGLAAALYFSYTSQKKGTAEVAQLRTETDQLRVALEESKKTKADAETSELVRLRRENEDVLRLRNEIRQLRDEKTQMSQQIQTAQNQAQSAQAALSKSRTDQPGAAGANPQAPLSPAGAAVGTQAAAEAEAFRRRYGLQPAAGAAVTDQEKLNVCVNQLRQIDGAIQQWALEKGKPVNTLVAAPDILPYIRGQALPTCPSGGSYSIHPVGTPPTCSIPGHAIAKPQ